MQEEFLFSGFGGQGVMFVGQLLAYAAMKAGLEVTWIPSYGPEMRGGTAHCFVVISDKPIGSPIVRNPKSVIVFNNPSFDKYEPIVAKNGLLAVNASLIESRSKRADLRCLYVPATQFADEIGDLRLTNVIMLGATLTAHPTIPLSTLQEALEEHIPIHRRNLLPMNIQALEKGATFVEGVLQM